MELVIDGPPDHGVEALPYKMIMKTTDTDIGGPLFDLGGNTFEFFQNFTIWSVVEAYGLFGFIVLQSLNVLRACWVLN